MTRFTNLGDLIVRDRDLDKVAVIDLGGEQVPREFSYAQLDAMSNAVARALLAPGSVLVLDEPTSGLDPALADELMDGVFAAAGTRSILVITHRAAEAARCGAVLTLEAGRAVSAQA